MQPREMSVPAFIVWCWLGGTFGSNVAAPLTNHRQVPEPHKAVRASPSQTLRETRPCELFSTRFVSRRSSLVVGRPPRAAEPQAKEPPKQGGFPDLVGALKASPGCLGVETAKTDSGKSVIFAWFEDKKAVLKWYHSDIHQQVMDQFFPDRDGKHKPLAGVPDDTGPIMMIASVTFNAKPTKENPSPFKQIAIEVYQPLKGGLAIGGSFAPKGMKVPEAKGYEKK